MSEQEKDREKLEELKNASSEAKSNQPLHTLDTLSEVMLRLKEEGYTTEFSLSKDCLTYRRSNKEHKIQVENFEVEDTYRFEGETNPSDASILYAITSEKHNLKGVLVGAYGVYAEDTAEVMKEKLK